MAADEQSDDRPDHLDDVTDGGCAELWERTSELRREDDADE